MEPACDNDGMKGGLNLRREWGNLSDPGKKEEGGKAGFWRHQGICRSHSEYVHIEPLRSPLLKPLYCSMVIRGKDKCAYMLQPVEHYPGSLLGARRVCNLLGRARNEIIRPSRPGPEESRDRKRVTHDCQLKQGPARKEGFSTYLMFLAS